MGGPSQFYQYHKGNSNRRNKDKSSKIRIELRKKTHSQVPQVREIKVLLMQNQPSQGMVLRRH